MKVTKLFQTTISSVDEANRTVKFCFSDDQTDRMGEIVDQTSWNVKSYESNPLILWGHNPDRAENVIGKALEVTTGDNGKSYVTAQFDDDEHASLVFSKLVKGFLRCVSAGFIPHTIDTEDDTPVLKDNELLEISVVPIPANPRAVALAYKEGSLSRKDAKFLLDSMRSETTVLEAQIKAHDEQRSKDMTDEQAKALIDSVATLTKSVEDLKTVTDERFKAIDEAVAELKPPVETDEEKQAREAKEAEEAEAARNAEEDAKNPDKPAKGGSDDQPGAGEDEFDEETELTPEQEAEMDAAFAEQLASVDEAA